MYPRGRVRGASFGMIFLAVNLMRAGVDTLGPVRALNAIDTTCDLVRITLGDL
jgi:hypothetical protein